MDESLNTAVTIANGVVVLFVLLVVYGIVELGYVRLRLHAARLGEYRMATFGVASVAVAGAVTAVLIGPISSTLVAIKTMDIAFWQAGYGPIGWIYGLIAYELAYWIQHWLAHKVRLLWCMHSAHHAPENMHMFVGFNHSFLESVFYMPIMLGFIPALLGAHPIVIAVVMLIDVGYGNMLHISDKVMPGRYGILERFLQTPSYHRVHHGQNVRYMDTNYNSITLLWDWVFRTLEPLDDAEPVTYGITRDVNTSSFLDVHFGGFAELWKDVRNADSIRDALFYTLMPPGWAPDDDSKTVAAQKRFLLAQASTSR